MTPTQIRELQKFLQSKGLYSGKIDGLWGTLTESGVRKARDLNLDIQAYGIPSEDEGEYLPSLPGYKALTGAQREKLFGGPFRWVHVPIKSNPENIKILDNWTELNITRASIPELAELSGGAYSRISCNIRCANQLKNLWKAWKAAGLLSFIKSYDGGYVPRLIRRSKTTLSNHAYGTAFDINAEWNPLGRTPAQLGQFGTVIPLVKIAAEHGFFWGGYFSRKDGMHFEVYKIIP